MNSIGKIFKIVNGRSYFAEVEIFIIPNSSVITVNNKCDGKGYIGQGAIEDVPKNGYDDWKRAAEEGILYALKQASLQKTVEVLRISGISSDTNPDIVYCAAVSAIWNALNFEPDQVTKDQLNNRITESWQKFG